MSNRIEQVIGDIEEYIDGCKMQAFSNTKIVVDRPQIEEFLDELRQYTPEEVKKYQRMLNNRDKILADAKKKASEVEEKAQAYADHMISENQITKMAYDKANEILRDAKENATNIVERAADEANQIREGAIAYTNELLNNLQSIIGGTIDDTQNRFSALMASLSDHLRIVEMNQSELNGQAQQAYVPETEEQTGSSSFYTQEAAEDEDED